MKKKLLSALATAAVLGSMSTALAAANPFSDVPKDHWAYDAVTQLAADGVIEGYGDGTFLGNRNITRASVSLRSTPIWFNGRANFDTLTRVSVLNAPTAVPPRRTTTCSCCVSSRRCMSMTIGMCILESTAR